MLLSIAALVFASCSSSGSANTTAQRPDRIRAAEAGEASQIHANRPAELVVLDVRTPEEFSEAHLDGATLLDFYETDFTDRLAELDRDAPYLLYCRSGNRSGQTAVLMDELGFIDVTEIEGGIVSWMQAGHPVVAP